jgi:hypothetical protein
MIISSISRKELETSNPTLLSMIEKEIDVLKRFSNEKDHSFIEAAVWADDNKELEFNQFTPWHYSDTPIITPDFSGDIDLERMNVTWAIKQMKNTLSNTSAPSFDSNLALSFSWRYLLHLVGDLHQPLHSSSLYSSQFPLGDEGGNLIRINFTDPAYPDVTNLHALWDACVGQYGSVYAPLAEEDYERVMLVVEEITKEVTKESVKEKLEVKDVEEWAKESYVIAKEFVYTVNDGDTITEDYIKQGRKIVNERLALAGYRLALMMEELYKPHVMISE